MTGAMQAASGQDAEHNIIQFCFQTAVALIYYLTTLILQLGIQIQTIRLIRIFCDVYVCVCENRALFTHAHRKD